MGVSEAREVMDGVPATFARWFGPPLDDFAGAEFDKYLAWHENLQAIENYLDINNTWQAIHFLLTGEFCFQGESQIEGPLRNVVMGGAPTEIETTYGVAHYLSAQDVAGVAAALEPLTVEAIAPRYDAAAFRRAQVYPLRDRWSQENGLRQFIGEYARLRAFFIAAAAENQAMFTASD